MVDFVPDVDDSIASNYDIEGEDRDRVQGDIQRRNQAQTSSRVDKPVSNAGWNHYSLPRSSLERLHAGARPHGIRPSADRQV